MFQSRKRLNDEAGEQKRKMMRRRFWGKSLLSRTSSTKKKQLETSQIFELNIHSHIKFVLRHGRKGNYGNPKTSSFIHSPSRQPIQNLPCIICILYNNLHIQCNRNKVFSPFLCRFPRLWLERLIVYGIYFLLSFHKC